MAAPLVRPLADGDLPAAARLLAARHARHRAACPELDPAFEDPAVALAELEAILALPAATAVVALRDGVVCGFAAGSPRDDATWGPNGWIEAAGHAAERAEDIRDLYAVLAAGWAASGRTAHSAVVPASDTEAVDAWFRLGFGHQHVHAVMTTPAAESIPQPPAGIAVRPAERGDIDVLCRLDVLLPEHQAASPVFSGLAVPSVEEAMTEYRDEWDDPRYFILVAEVEGAVVGSIVGSDVSESPGNAGMVRPSDAGFIGFVSVLPEARGRGVGRALAHEVIRWTASSGKQAVAIDWRTTNLLASRAWTAMGFRPTFLRLHRRL